MPANFKSIFIIGAVILTTGCATNHHRYHWGGYETSLYGYFKNPEKFEKYVKEVEKAVLKGQEKGNVAPGMYAEYGYVLVALKRPEEAKKYFLLEKEAWPESTKLMDLMIANPATGTVDVVSEAGNTESSE